MRLVTKLMLTAISLIMAALLCFSAMGISPQKNEDVNSVTESELTKACNETSFYVELNNKRVKALDDYVDGKISEDEYMAICEDINSQLASYGDMMETE